MITGIGACTGGEWYKSQRGSALLGSTILAGGALTAAMFMQTKTMYHAESQSRSTLQHGMIGLTKSALETTEQLINALDVSERPFFYVERGGANFQVSPNLSPYLQQVYRHAANHQFTFRHCASMTPAMTDSIFRTGSTMPTDASCSAWITTTVVIVRIADEHVIAKATSSLLHRGRDVTYKISAKLKRTHVPMNNCPWVDPADYKRLHPDYVGEIPGLISNGRTVTVWTARYLPNSSYSAVTNTVHFNFWTFNGENADHLFSTYRWDQFYNAYPGYVGNVTTHLMAGHDDVAANYVKDKPGFVRGNYIWNGGWNHRFYITIHNPNGNCSLSLTRISGSPPGQRNGGCFSENTQIRLANGKDVSVQDLKLGDRVYNPVSKSAALVYGVVAGPEEKSMLRLGTNGRLVTITDEHPMLTRRGLLPARQVKPDDELFCEARYWCSIESLEWLPVKTMTVYNVSLMANSDDARDHFLLADGVPAGDLYLQKQLASGATPQLNIATEENMRLP